MANKAVVLAVSNQKGGTGKTTTCENLGIGLAQEGKKVLLVDTDPQASLTVALGYPRPDDLSFHAVRCDGKNYDGAADCSGGRASPSPGRR